VASLQRLDERSFVSKSHVSADDTAFEPGVSQQFKMRAFFATERRTQNVQHRWISMMVGWQYIVDRIISNAIQPCAQTMRLGTERKYKSPGETTIVMNTTTL
jgi:hypothetical protein